MKNFLLLSLVIMFAFKGFAQGCSDAGICSVGSNFELDEIENKNSLETATIFAAGEEDLIYFSPYISYARKLNDQFSISTKLTFSSANGSYGTKSAFGDIYLIGNYVFKEKESKQWSVLTGWKFPLNNADLKIDGISLPLDYQSSLGTIDLFVGTNFKYYKWDFTATIQIPIFNHNKNSFFNELSESEVFPSTNLFERKSDALFRVTYTYKTTNQKFTFKPNLLFIYHLGEDTFENELGNRETIKNSSGLTVNGNLLSSYQINNGNSIELSLATPFVIRDVRPDGLTRSFVLGLSYRTSF